MAGVAPLLLAFPSVSPMAERVAATPTSACGELWDVVVLMGVDVSE